jgi:hypothetical protein
MAVYFFYEIQVNFNGGKAYQAGDHEPWETSVKNKKEIFIFFRKKD